MPEIEYVWVERLCRREGKGGREGWRQKVRERERERALGKCFAEVSAVDKVFMTLGQFSADIQELHATRPLMKVS